MGFTLRFIKFEYLLLKKRAVSLSLSKTRGRRPLRATLRQAANDKSVTC